MVFTKGFENPIVNDIVTNFQKNLKIFPESFNQFAQSHHTATKNEVLNFPLCIPMPNHREFHSDFEVENLEKMHLKLTNLLQTLPIDGIH